MTKKEAKKSVLSIAKTWATKNKIFGTQAFLRYVIFRFVENLNEVSDQFTFKGGNVLWVYIKTPRGTIDLDLSSASAFSDVQAKAILEKACVFSDDIQYRILIYKQIIQENRTGAAAVVGFQTKDGAKNQFEIDLVFKCDDNAIELPSPIDESRKIKCVSIENIISDKLTACHRFGSGNSRMKDFDDLWRLSDSSAGLDRKLLLRLLKKRDAGHLLDKKWITPELIHSWHSHQKRYDDLPDNLDTLFKGVNKWLREIGIDNK